MGLTTRGKRFDKGEFCCKHFKHQPDRPCPKLIVGRPPPDETLSSSLEASGGKVGISIDKTQPSVGISCRPGIQSSGKLIKHLAKLQDSQVYSSPSFA
jgi:hypothetical protein